MSFKTRIVLFGSSIPSKSPLRKFKPQNSGGGTVGSGGGVKVSHLLPVVGGFAGSADLRVCEIRLVLFSKTPANLSLA